MTTVPESLPGFALDSAQHVSQYHDLTDQLMLDVGGYRAKRRADLTALAGEEAFTDSGDLGDALGAPVEFDSLAAQIEKLSLRQDADGRRIAPPADGWPRSR